MITVFENADLYTPKKVGFVDVVFDGDYTIKVGDVDKKVLLKSGLDVEVINLDGKILIPGIIDPHVHLLGGSGETGGFSSQTPEVTLTELTLAGTTTVVGTLGADTNMKTMAGLLAKAKGLNEEGLSAFIWTGGYEIPPKTIMASPRDDIMFIQEVIGTGEVAIADERSDDPQIDELSRVVSQTHLAGMLSKKCGLTHFHVGEGKNRMKLLFDMLDTKAEIRCEWLYPTHISRSKELMEDAARLAKMGAFVDMDMVNENLAAWLPVYIENGGPMDRLTLSSDAAITSPSNLFNEIRHCVLYDGYKLEDLLPLVTSNTAKALQLEEFGSIKERTKANYVALDENSLEIVHVISRGEFHVRDGRPVHHENFLKNSNRHVDLTGEKYIREPI